MLDLSKYYFVEYCTIIFGPLDILGVFGLVLEGLCGLIVEK